MPVTINDATYIVVPTDALRLHDSSGSGSWQSIDDGKISVVSSSLNVDDDGSSVEVSVTRSGGSSGAASVQYETVNGSASAGTDYNAVSGSFEWGAGQSGARSVVISTIDRSGEEQGDSQFTFRIFDAQGALISEDGDSLLDTTTIAINDTFEGTDASPANLLVDGSFPNGTLDYVTWWRTEHDYPNMWPILEDYRPPSAHVGPNAPSHFSGNGSNAQLVTPGGGGSYLDGPVRSGNYSIRMRIHNSAMGGGNEADPLGGATHRRRAEIYQFRTAIHEGTSIRRGESRWASVSYFIPSNWSDGGSDYLNVWQMKSEAQDGSPSFLLQIHSGEWRFNMKWDTEVMPRNADIPWQFKTQLRSSTASSNDQAQDFPNHAASTAALASLNKGGWTDWVMHVRPDPNSAGSHDGPTNGNSVQSGVVYGRGSGGNGFLDLYKREDDGPWVHVVSMVPRLAERGGIQYQRGIWYEGEGVGWAHMVGFYMHWNQADVTPARVIYVDNVNTYPSGETLARIAARLTHS